MPHNTPKTAYLAPYSPLFLAKEANTSGEQYLNAIALEGPGSAREYKPLPEPKQIALTKMEAMVSGVGIQGRH